MAGYKNKLYVHANDGYPDFKIRVYSVSVPDMKLVNETPFLEGADGKYGTSDDEANPKYQERTLKFEEEFFLTGQPENRYLAQLTSTSEMFVDERGIFTFCAHADGFSKAYDICLFGFDGKYKSTDFFNKKAQAAEYNETMPKVQCLGWDELNGKWYMSTMDRHVFRNEPDESWGNQFTHADMVGDHGDGLEVVVSPHGDSLIYLTDMTSNFISQWGFGDNYCTEGEIEEGWAEWKRFSYVEIFNDDMNTKFVEGMGFGPLGHFWFTSHFDNPDGPSLFVLYELGGGSLGAYLPPPIIE